MATWKKVLTEAEIATSTSLGTSNTVVPSQNAVKSYVDNNSSNVTIDASLSSSSANPVENHVVYDALALKEDAITSSNRLNANLIGANGNVSNTEYGYLSTVSSNIQTQLNNKQATITGAATSIDDSNLTVNRALISNSSGKVAVSTASSTELGYLDGVTSAIQTQLDGKASTGGSATQNFATNNLSVAGNLTVSGDTTTLNVSTLEVEDKLVVLGKSSGSEANASGAGIQIDTGQSLKPELYWWDDTVGNNTDGRIGIGWKVKTTTESVSESGDSTTNYHVMGFKVGTGAPSGATKASGEGAFYWDESADALYLCTSSFTSL